MFNNCAIRMPAILWTRKTELKTFHYCKTTLIPHQSLCIHNMKTMSQTIFDTNALVRFQVLTAASMMFRVVFWCVRTSETSVENNFTRQYIPEDNSEHKCTSYLITWINPIVALSAARWPGFKPPEVKASLHCQATHTVILIKNMFNNKNTDLCVCSE
jgi:hypothetical protein